MVITRATEVSTPERTFLLDADDDAASGGTESFAEYHSESLHLEGPEG